MVQRLHLAPRRREEGRKAAGLCFVEAAGQPKEHLFCESTTTTVSMAITHATTLR
jgi:hypothetical protein